MGNFFRDKIKALVFLLLAIVLILQPSGFHNSRAQAQGKAVTILFTSDMHDNFLPFKSVTDGKITSLGGYARLMTAIEQQRQLDPEAVLVDGGDYSMGTPFQTIFASKSPQLRIMGSMGYDATTFGNHEYDYRPEGLAKSLESAIASGEPLPAIVQANVTFPADKDGKMSDDLARLKNAMEEYKVRDYIVIERNGVRIGIFGIMGKESASMAPMSGVVFTDPVESAKKVVKALKEQEQVDLIICLSHSGTSIKKDKSEDVILAKSVPDIDVIISGHSHTRLEEPIIVGNTVIGSPEDYGRYLGVIKLVQSEAGSWELEKYQLVLIDEGLKEDEGLARRIEEFKAMVQEEYFELYGLEYDEVIAYSPFQFQTPDEISRVHADSTIGNLIGDAYIYAVKKAEGANYEPVAAAVVPTGTVRSTIYKGPVTVADAFCISSLGVGADGIPGYPLISVYLTGKELKTLCEVDASIAPIMSTAQLYPAGLSYSFNPNRLIFNKVTDVALMDADGIKTEIDDKKLYRVIAGLYSAQMLSVVGEKSFGLMSLVPKNKDGEPITDFEEHIIYQNIDGKQQEVKEWYAIVEYLKSFDQVEGVSQIPDYYSQTHGRKIVDDNKNIINLVKNPNAISLTVYIAVPLLAALIILLLVKLVKLIRRRIRRQG